MTTTTSARDTIWALAQTHNIGPTPSPLEALGNAITRLADDEPFNDDTDRLLVALAHAKKIDDQTFSRLCHAWQLEKRRYRSLPIVESAP